MRVLIPALLATSATFTLVTVAVASPAPLAAHLQAMCGEKQAVKLVLATGAQRLAVAEALATRLQAPLQKVVTSRYIGETEKNIDGLLARAAEAGAILFFDEADALFGRRAAVGAAGDRYANQEVSYLRQRLEASTRLVIVGLDQAPARVPAAGIVLGDPADLFKICR